MQEKMSFKNNPKYDLQKCLKKSRAIIGRCFHISFLIRKTNFLKSPLIQVHVLGACT